MSNWHKYVLPRNRFESVALTFQFFSARDIRVPRREYLVKLETEKFAP